MLNKIRELIKSSYINGETISLKDGTEINLVYDVEELKKINTAYIKRFFDDLIDEYTFMAMTIKQSIKETHRRFKTRLSNMRQGNTIIVYAMHHKKIVGNITIVKKIGRANHLAELGMSVKKECRKKGLGKLLLKYGLGLIITSWPETKIVEINCYENNTTALKMYKEFGFKQVAKIPNSLQWQPPKQKEMQYKARIVMHYNIK